MTAAPVSRACRAIGLDRSEVLGASPVGGGCINEALKLRTTAGTFFLKWNARAQHRFFEVEADGLEAIARAGTVATPAVLARSREGDQIQWLLLEWIEEGSPDTAAWRRLGHELASLHRGEWDGGYGWHSDNVIGSLPQPNQWTDDWGDFWAEMRIRPLARELRANGALTQWQLRAIEEAAERTGSLLGPAAEADGRSLLHGDLWSGNVLFGRRAGVVGGRGGEGDDGVARGGADPVLIDPAVYIGHREVDLAMSRLFGGFPALFYEAYNETWPLHPGHEQRRSAYQLYPLLVHARLFGGGYVASAVDAAEAMLAT